MTVRSLLGVIVLCASFLPAQDQSNHPTDAQQAVPAAQPSQAVQPEAAKAAEPAKPDAPTTKPAAEFARLHIYRARRYAGSALAPSIAVDGQKVARVGNGRRVTIRLTPGSHTISSDDKASSITVEAKAGAEYYIRVDEETGFWKGHGKLTMLLPEQGSAEYKLQKPIEPDRKVVQEMIEEDPGDAAAPAKGK